MKNKRYQGKNGYVKREQPKKDSKSKRVNDDNERMSKFIKREESGPDKMKDSNCSNDVRWYASNPELLKAAASLPFSVVVGQQLQGNAGWSVGTTVPGILSMYFLPSLGGGNLDALNAAKDSIYSFVVHANSRNTSYTSADLMEVIIAGMNVFAAWASGVRAFGVARLYDQRNKYLPDGLLCAMGFSPTDIRSNLSHMWFDLNELAARMSQIWIPNTMPVLDRWFWLNSNVYMDGDSVKSQYYVFTQEKFLGFNETSQPSGGTLEWVNVDGTISSTTGTRYSNSSSYYTWSQYMTMMNGLITALVDSEDRGVIMGDIMKAYGADKIYAVNPISADYTITPVYDREVLTQIENATTFGRTYFGIYQDQSTGRLVQGWPTGTTSTAPKSWSDIALNQSILNFHQKETPTPEQIMVATRMKCLGTTQVGQASDFSLEVTTAGTEYVRLVRSFNFGNNNTIHNYDWTTRIDQSISLVSIMEQFCEFSAFDWCPWLTVVNGTLPTDASPTIVQPTIGMNYGDFDNYTIITLDELKKMHDTALYSEFGVPVI